MLQQTAPLHTSGMQFAYLLYGGVRHAAVRQAAESRSIVISDDDPRCHTRYNSLCSVAEGFTGVGTRCERYVAVTARRAHETLLVCILKHLFDSRNGKTSHKSTSVRRAMYVQVLYSVPRREQEPCHVLSGDSSCSQAT